MKIGVICGSHRNESQSEKIGRYAAEQLSRQGFADDTYVFTLAGNPLPFWDEGMWSGDPKWAEALGELRADLAACEGFVVVTPEWHGMVPAGLKNFFLLLAGSGELAHKPALIIAVAGGAGGGAYPVAELRMSSYKNSRICYLPEHLIVRNAGKVFNADEADNDAESHDYLHQRLLYGLDMLAEYSRALTTVRATGKTSLETYKNGM
ncbi:MAG: NAD(P)H-dependent oxidoreductase [Halieaceae bacterium]|jgi:NAD(P)H-dependent FMN reductase|nr:NAD(P)H-dependent oxidoreductase [Halieaceae bacterium]